MEVYYLRGKCCPWKSRFFIPPLHSTPSSEYCHSVWCGKTRMRSLRGAAENARMENATPENAAPDCRDGKCRTGKCGTNMQGWKTWDLKIWHQTAGVENAGLESAGNDIVLNAAHCLCLLSFAWSKRWVGLKELECDRYRSVVDQLTTIATTSSNQIYALQSSTLQCTAHAWKTLQPSRQLDHLSTGEKWPSMNEQKSNVGWKAIQLWL